MSIIDRNPQTTNKQSSANFYFYLQRAPSLTYFCNAFELPDIMLPPVKVPSPSLNVPLAGDHLRYGGLVATFQVDEKIQNWLEMFNWMTALGNPNNEGTGLEILQANPDWAGFGQYSQLILLILDSQKVPTYKVVFEHCFPTALSGLKFTTTDGTVRYLDATVAFGYSKYYFDTV